jgi:hypothetical protein
MKRIALKLMKLNLICMKIEKNFSAVILSRKFKRGLDFWIFGHYFHFIFAIIIQNINYWSLLYHSFSLLSTEICVKNAR